MKNLTAIVISFLRPGYTKACIQSLRDVYPDIQIIVGENGKLDKGLAKICKKVGAKYIDLPFDSGVCVGRNTLMKHVKTDYVLVGDDDFFYTGEARVDDMLSFLEWNDEFDLIGGRILEGGQVKNYQGFTEKHDDHFKSIAIDLEEEEFTDYFNSDDHCLRYCSADLTFNFFVARTAKVKEVPWDEKIKVAYEHFSWFYDFKLAGGKVAFSPDPIVVHKPEHVKAEISPEYRGYRLRQDDKKRFFEKYKIDYFLNMNGTKTYAPDHKFEVRKNDTKMVDFCITTFKRPQAVRNLLLSIARFYPHANIYVADQNEKLDYPFYNKLRRELFNLGLQKRPSIQKLPYDCGLSFARNHLVKTTPNMYKLILDDDMEFTEKTDIKKMVSILQAFPRVAIVGGLMQQLGQDVNFEFDWKIEDGVLYHISDGNVWRDFEGTRYKKTKCVLNFALIRKDIFNLITWDRNLKVTEHMDFYIRMRKLPYEIFYTPDVVIDHPPHEREADYKELRQRAEFFVKMFKKHKLKKIKYLNGQCFELMPDDSIKRSKELPE